MRIAALFALLVTLSAGQALAIGDPPPPPASLTVVNNCDGAVSVSLNGSEPFVLEPLGEAGFVYDIWLSGKNGAIKVNVSATLVGTSLSASKDFQLKSGQSELALIDTNRNGTRLTIGSPKGQLAFSRETAVVVASSGGLLPLLMLGWLFGGGPRRREMAGKTVCQGGDTGDGRDTQRHWPRLGSAALAVLLVGLLAGPVLALPGDGNGGGNPKQSGTLVIINRADAAVEVSASSSKATLEPGGSLTTTFSFQNEKDVNIHAKLVGSPSVSDHERCPLTPFETTTATITSDGTTLTITCPSAGVALLSRESAVVAASSGGLLPLLLLGWLLGGGPRRRDPIVNAIA